LPDHADPGLSGVRVRNRDMTDEALFHFQIGRVQPSKGDSLHKVAAYQRACRLCGPDGTEYDFTRKTKNQEYAGGFWIAAPDAPADLLADPAALWSAAIKKEHRRDGNPAILLEFTIPDAVKDDEREDFVRAVAGQWVRDGAIGQVDLHQPFTIDGSRNDDGSRRRNRHAHIIVSRFALGPDGFTGKKLGDEPFQPKNIVATRAATAAAMNKWFKAHGYDVAVDHRSNAERGIDIAPERNVSRQAVELAKAKPDEAYAYSDVIAERRERRRLKTEKAALALEITVTQAEIVNIERELQDARSNTADPADIRTNLDVDPHRGESDARRHTTDPRTAPAAEGRRRGPHRPDPSGPGRRAGEPVEPARKSRPTRHKVEDVTLGRATRRAADDDLAKARDRLHEADGRGAKARKRAHERAEFRGARPDAEERLRNTRKKAKDAGAPGVGPSSPVDRLARRRRLLAGLIREAYDTGWLPESVADNIRDIKLDRAAGVVTLYLNGGGRITDNGERIILAGRPTASAVQELLTAADRHGWTSGGIEVSGDAEFRRAVALELLSRRPPVTVTGLDAADKAAVAEALEQRQRDRRRAALDALIKAERVAAEAYNLRPNGRRETEVLAAVRDAQAAVSDNDDNAIDAAMTGDIPGAMRAGMSWRQRITPAAPAVDMTIEPDAPAMTLLPAYRPPWITDPGWKAKQAGSTRSDADIDSRTR
jgi:MobA/MobL family/Large polyvalent protein-associated domain 7